MPGLLIPAVAGAEAAGSQPQSSTACWVISALIAALILCLTALAVSVVAKRNYRKMVRSLVAKAPLGILILDRKHSIVMYNLALGVMVGSKRQEVEQWLEAKEIREWLARPEARRIVTVGYGPDRRQKYVKVDMQRVGSLRLFLVVDTTAEMVSKEILSWYGFAQRLGHDIKNPLSAINLTLQRMQDVAREKLGVKARVLDRYSKSMLEEIQRLRKTTDRFLRVLALDQSVLNVCDINLIAARVLQRYEASLPPEIRVKKVLARDLPRVKCDENQLAAALANLVENSFEALTGKGVVTLRTLLIEKALGKEPGSNIKQYIEIKVEDTGRGLTGEQMRSLFRPFYSTKAGGTGLGLVITKKIVEEHGGMIRIDSKKDAGTIATIEIPVSQGGSELND